VGDLRLIDLSDVKLLGIMGGGGILLRTISDPFVGYGGVVALAEDSTGDVEFVTFGFFDTRRDVKDWLPKGRIFVVKEPYCAYVCDGELAIIANSPSDIYWLPPTQQGIGSWREPPGDFEEWKAKGNAAFAEGKWYTALRCYQRAKAINDLNWQIHSNLAVTYLRLEQPVPAVEAGLRALKLDGGNNPRVLHRMGEGMCHAWAFEPAICAWRRRGHSNGWPAPGRGSARSLGTTTGTRSCCR
jgi:hypothetical protein